MIARVCDHTNRKKHGKDRKGQQRWKCMDCGVTFTSDEQRPLGDMRIDLAGAVKILSMLLEGMSIRACERICGVCRATICDLVLHVGENYARWLDATVRGVAADDIQLDELWDFVAMKARTKEKRGYKFEEVGDAWTWLAIDSSSKLVLAHAVGQRDEFTCERFLKQLNAATTGECQVTTDGLRLYTHRVPQHLGSRASFAQLVKTYGHEQVETRPHFVPLAEWALSLVCIALSTAQRLAWAANSGINSPTCKPGTLVGIEPNSPRISALVSGLGSQVSCCGGPPAINSTMQFFALPISRSAGLVCAVALRPANNPSSVSPPRLIPPDPQPLPTRQAIAEHRCRTVDEQHCRTRSLPLAPTNAVRTNGF